MHRIDLDIEGCPYGIFVGKGLIGKLPELFSELPRPSRMLVVSDATVAGLYGEALREALEPVDYDLLIEVIPGGEENKSLATVEHLLGRMAGARLDRRSLVLILGGGVVGDIGGFAASIYMRGIPYVQVPTTLLAQVDSSIGGKVGVDSPVAKNLIGAFHHPRFVCVDPDVLSSLPQSQLRNGMAEVIKYGMIAEESLFALIERHSDSLLAVESSILEDIIQRCCHIKARVVQQDPCEITGLRAILNYGHTIGHAIESVTKYSKYGHGEAVSIGMMAAARIAAIMNLISDDVLVRQQKLLSAAGLPTEIPGIQTAAVIEAARLDKKAAGGKLTFVLPLAVGRVIVKDNIPTEIVQRALTEMGAG